MADFADDGGIKTDVAADRAFQNAVSDSRPVGKITEGTDITISLAGPNGRTISVPGKPGDTVYASETITTGDNGFAKIKLGEKDTLTLGADSNFAMQSLDRPSSGVNLRDLVRSAPAMPDAEARPYRAPAPGGVRG